MQIEHYILLSVILVGIGLGSALSHRNIIAVIMAIVTAGTGVLVAMAAFDAMYVKEAAARTDGTLFAMCMGAVLLTFIVLGCAIAYRRFTASGTTNISEGNQLRH